MTQTLTNNMSIYNNKNNRNKIIKQISQITQIFQIKIKRIITRSLCIVNKKYRIINYKINKNK